jgi:hypothetical protein
MELSNRLINLSLEQADVTPREEPSPDHCRKAAALYPKPSCVTFSLAFLVCATFNFIALRGFQFGPDDRNAHLKHALFLLIGCAGSLGVASWTGKFAGC